MLVKKHIIIYILMIIFSSCTKNKTYTEENPSPSVNIQDAYFCIDGPIEIWNEPNNNSEKNGLLNLFDIANIIGKDEISSEINGINDYWYKINFNGTEGYVFGGYGVVLYSKYELKTIDDFVNALPSKFQIKKHSRKIYYYSYRPNGIPTVKLHYNIMFMDHPFVLQITCRPTYRVDANYMSLKYNLEISDASDGFGSPYVYNRLISTADELITYYNDQGRYFYSWTSVFGYDSAYFLFEKEFDSIFDGMIITLYDLWLNSKDEENINKIDVNFINEARVNRIKESILFQIFYEIILRVKFE